VSHAVAIRQARLQPEYADATRAAKVRGKPRRLIDSPHSAGLSVNPLSASCWARLFAFAAALVAIKLWLIQDLSPLLLADAMYDDGLFLRLARSISLGEWLGPFDHRTLIKGSFFSIWLAIVNAAGIPFVWAQSLLMASAALTAAAVWLRLGMTPVASLAGLVLLVFHPVTVSDFLLRASRELLYAVETLLVVIGLTAVAARGSTWRSWLATGAALAPFWLTREEGIWILPAIGIALALRFAPGLRTNSWTVLKQGSACVALIAVVPLLANQAVRHANQAKYGVAVATEFRADYFNEAFGAIQRVKPDVERRYVPMARSAREKAYAASPAFSSLRRHLEISHSGWFSPCIYIDPCDDYSSHFVWAFREAIVLEGKYRSLSESRRFYRQLSTEINEACSTGELDCHGPHGSVRPIMHASDIPHVFESFWESVAFVALGGELRTRNHAALGTPAQIGKAAAFLHHAELGRPATPLSSAGEARAAILDAIHPIFKFLFLIGIPAGSILWVARGLTTRRTPSRWVGPVAIVVTALLSRSGMLAVVDATAFDGVNAHYHAPSFVLVAVLFVLILATATDGDETLRATASRLRKAIWTRRT